jgi:hypothetical protein
MAVKSSSDVALAIQATLTEFLPAHLAALPRRGRTTALPTPGRWDLLPTEDNVRWVKGAGGAVSVPSTAEEPSRDGRGVYSVVFVANVALFHENKPSMPVDTAPGDYAAAITECMVQHPTHGGIATATVPQGHDTSLVGDGTTPSTLGLAVVQFHIKVPAYLDMTPPRLPSAGPGPTVQSTSTVTSVR